ncbi:uncharacterized protein A4U43_C05F23970 [Asparagus officinalis]|uniref:BHLH domain-containing protein n=1 Tax=Asparagus officinalis TaxID=4686 RepID=A0A5P1EU71_ASPOF|nr:uncharacterized protein A4U43_C05F23970 [Asparagus officinalis]
MSLKMFCRCFFGRIWGHEGDRRWIQKWERRVFRRHPPSTSPSRHPLASPWEESALLPDNSNFSSPPPGLKRHREGPTETQNGGEVRNGGLSHQFSFPKTSSEVAAMEKFLQFQDSVPCKIRAKRGCATHPRSIAERVRRTRISERMRKLQELVPNMDKQTNTADMLDLAVDYIKELQKQVKAISENRANCTCSSSSKQKPYTSPAV